MANLCSIGGLIFNPIYTDNLEAQSQAVCFYYRNLELSIMPNAINKLLNFGVEDEFGNDLNQKHVVNFSYIAFCVVCFVISVTFFSRQMTSLGWFSLGCFCIALLGLRLSYLGYFNRAQLLFPIVKTIQISVLSLFCFGAESDYHWMFSCVIAYAFIVFRPDQRFAKLLITSGSIILFLFCELMGLKGLYFSSQSREIISLLVFFSVASYFSVVINLVMIRLKSVNHYLRVLAEKDELTGLSNRRKVLADAVVIYTDAVLNKSSCVFVIMDLDHFKKINDTYGHEAGDLVLTEVSKMMASVMRPQDEIGRYGGEEFIVIMRETNLKQAAEIIERMREEIENMLIETPKGIIIPVSISAGLASISPGVTRYEEILAHADKGLYIAKRNGRNRIFIQSSDQD